MRMAAVKRGLSRQPRKRIVIYGPKGSGKTTWATEGPGKLLLPAEVDEEILAKRPELAHFPVPQTMRDCFEALDVLQHEPALRDATCLVVDSLSAVEQLAWLASVANDQGDTKAKGIEDVGGGYGKGYTAAFELIRDWLRRLDQVAEARHLDVILIAHGVSETIHDPSVADYDTWAPRLYPGQKGGKASIKDLIMEWCSELYFVLLERVRVQRQDSKRSRAKRANVVGRALCCQPGTGWEAKSRAGLPAKIPLDWWEWQRHWDAAHKLEVDPRLLAEAVEAVEALPESLRYTGKGEPLVERAQRTGNPGLQALIAWAGEKLDEIEEEEDAPAVGAEDDSSATDGEPRGPVPTDPPAAQPEAPTDDFGPGEQAEAERELLHLARNLDPDGQASVEGMLRRMDSWEKADRLADWIRKRLKANAKRMAELAGAFDGPNGDGMSADAGAFGSNGTGPRGRAGRGMEL